MTKVRTALLAAAAVLAFTAPSMAVSPDVAVWGKCAGDCIKKHPEVAKVCYVAEKPNSKGLFIHCDVDTPTTRQVAADCEKAAAEAVRKSGPTHWSGK